MKGRKRLCAALAAIWMGCFGLLSGARGEELFDYSLDSFEEKGLDLGDSSVHYPALKEGPEELRQKVNDQILADGEIPAYVTRMSQLISGGSLRVGWRGCVLGAGFSFAVSAEGAVESLRPSFRWTGGTIDLRSGEEIAWADLFTDADEARRAVEEYLEECVAPEMSAHLLSSALTPLPEKFWMTERGLILLYPRDQLSTLSDRAGDVLIPWPVVREWLNQESGGVAEALGLLKGLPLGAETSEAVREENAENLRRMTEEGRIPGIPAALGDRMQELTDRWRLLIDPDIYASGRLFSLEGASFWQVFLMTDYLTESWENSLVDGIRMDLGSIYGLTVGETTRESWRELLGEPAHTIDFDEERAEAWRTVTGSRDYYEFGSHRLQLHGDEQGILRSLILSE